MTTILNVAEVALYVTDLPRARRFYSEVLGLPVTLSFADSCFLQTGPNSTLILFDVDQLETRNSEIPGHGARGQGHVALSVPGEEMAAWRERLEAHGVPIEHEQTWSQGTRSIYFRDPDQNSLELIEAEHYPAMWDRIEE